jgi:hypothetical protein
VTAVVIFLIFLIGFIYTFKIGGGSRISERSITQGALEEGAEEKIKLIQDGANPIQAKFFHNKYQVITQRFVSNYSQYFSWRFLFKDGVAESSYGMVPGIGVIYIFEGILFLGLIVLLLDKKIRPLVTILLIWLLITPLPAALASGIGFSGNRAEGMIPILQILETFGFVGWAVYLKKINKNILLTIFTVFCIFSFFQASNFVKTYFRNPSDKVAQGMSFGNLEVFKWFEITNGLKIKA